MRRSRRIVVGELTFRFVTMKSGTDSIAVRDGIFGTHP